MVDGAQPVWLTDQMEWVEKVIGAARKSPFSRIKSVYADITADEARAKGYVKEAEKFEEVFPVFSRTTTPQTVYKKQKLDRDDIVDITDFNVVAWLKKEMKMKLREELARAILVGDGRANGHADKIKPEHVRPIWQDDAVYTHVHSFAVGDDIVAIIDGVVAAREYYKGSGNPSLFVSPATLSAMMLVRDADGRRLHKTKAELTSALMVKEVVEIPLLAGLNRVDGDTFNLVGILVNMRDYVVGADKGGQTTFFEDFDIDFNQHKYLYETRVSGALVLPKAAIVFEQDTV
jgi:HK97 family phage major capsid protein